MALPKKTTQQAINDLVRVVYNGNSPDVAATLRSILTRGVKAGGLSPALQNQIAPYLQGYVSPDEIGNQVKGIASNEYAYQQDPQSFIKSELAKYGADNASLTDQELQTKQELLKALGQDINTSRFTGESQAVGPGGVSGLPTDILTPSTFKGIDTSGDLKGINDILSARQLKAGNEAALQDFLTQAPIEQKANREQYLSGLADQAKGEYQDYIPQAQQLANQRGLLFSGDPGDMLAAKAVDLSGQQDQIRAQLEAEDNQFFADAAYQQALRKELDTNTQYGDYLNNQRDTLRTNQEQNFQGAEAQRKRQADLNNSELSYKSQLNAQEIALKRQNDLLQAQRKQASFSNIGTAVGTVGGAAVGGPTGAIIGGQAGGSAAASVPGSIY